LEITFSGELYKIGVSNLYFTGDPSLTLELHASPDGLAAFARTPLV
jgi:hypothetical protein